MRGGRRVGLAVMAALVGSAGMGGAPARAAATPPFIPISYQRLAVPATVQPWGLTWFPDGQHILFENEVDLSLWTVGANGNDPHCLTCAMSDFPKVTDTSGEFSYLFPDQQRLLVAYDEAAPPSDPPAGADAWVIECHPSVLDCATHAVLPVNLSADEAGAQPVLERRTFHLAPDGVHLGWMDVRTDGTMMVVATLQRNGSGYDAVGPRVINPAGPTAAVPGLPGLPGLSDPDPQHWETAGQVFELKAFTNGGADALVVGQPSAINPDQELVNLATGQITRLTSNPDWDEDGAISPDGAYLTDASFRTMHGTDVLGLLGMLPNFIDLPTAAAAAGYYVSSHDGFQCDLTPWLLPATGDQGGRLLGQPLGPYTGGSSYVANNFLGAPTWSPDGTRILLDERLYGPPQGGGQEAYMGAAPHEVLIARLGRRPARPLPVVSSAIGSWAATPATFNTGFATPGVVTLHGPMGGTATVTYVGNLLDGQDSVSYDHYTADGVTFVDGTESIQNPAFLAEPQTWQANITVSGAHTGYLRADLIWNGAKTSGPISTALDGYALNGLPGLGACPARMPHVTPLVVRTAVKRRGRHGYRVRIAVTASIAGTGLTEQGRDTRAVQGARGRIFGRRFVTGANGVAVVALPRPAAGRRRLRVTAGDTFAGITRRIRLRR
jgi:hypothetical protein